ncbi:hypothetical protein [Leptolyngbya sp. FACHB-261]|uniref:hypothetical protein n=1 Tax=Leptolyngbya sp. FACHB-261 TaxID=2692806 RepID=UPI001684F610|nr:hypothetical protein [Leptolyngbya sp. FACHB-261]MBD2104293.1 hypothetical protein [Leptolyngbya sp. FACHB-261]
MDSQDDVSQLSNEERHIDELDWLSDYLDRAIRGIFIFIFQKLPTWVGNTLTSVVTYTFDFLWRLVRGVTYFLKQALVWLFWTLPKKVLDWLFDSANYLLRLGRTALQVLILATVPFGPLLLSLKVGQFVWASSAWCLLATIGAVWGLIYLNRSRWKIGQTTGRLVNKLKFWRRRSVPEFVEK